MNQSTRQVVNLIAQQKMDEIEILQFLIDKHTEPAIKSWHHRAILNHLNEVKTWMECVNQGIKLQEYKP